MSACHRDTDAVIQPALRGAAIRLRDKADSNRARLGPQIASLDSENAPVFLKSLFLFACDALTAGNARQPAMVQGIRGFE